MNEPLTTYTPELEPVQQPSLDAVGPHFGYVLVLLPILVVSLAFGPLLFLLAAHHFNYMGHHALIVYRDLAESDARVQLPMQAAAYLMAIALIIPVFRILWNRPVSKGLHWNVASAKRYLGRLCLTGVCCAFGTGALGALLPMPKDPPIVGDIMHSQMGAWLMLIFGVTAAPAFEEMVFRGFLLPAFMNTFRWLRLRGDLPDPAGVWIAAPASAVLASLPFAIMHGAQVSFAWAPILLIGIVSLVLCVVRLRLNSLAASTVVHAAYNLTLFSGMLIATGGFRHMDRLMH